MPIFVDISPLDRVIHIVARGRATVEDVSECVEKLKDPKIRGYAKLVDVTGVVSMMSAAEVWDFAASLRGPLDAPLRGPLAFLVDPDRPGFAEVFSDASKDDRPIALFKSLRDAREWLAANLLDRPGHTWKRTSASHSEGISPP
jgi:hypothetical protein